MADLGNMIAQNSMGVRYQNGDCCIFQKDFSNQKKYYKLAAEQGYAKGQYNYAVCLKQTARIWNRLSDKEGCLTWYLKAYCSGHDNSLHEFISILVRYPEISDFCRIKLLKLILTSTSDKRKNLEKTIPELVLNCDSNLLGPYFMPFYFELIERGDFTLIADNEMFEHLLNGVNAKQLKHLANLVIDAGSRTSVNLPMGVYESLITSCYQNNIVMEKEWFDKCDNHKLDSAEYYILKALSLEQEYGENNPQSIKCFYTAFFEYGSYLLDKQPTIFAHVFNLFYKLAIAGDTHAVEMVLKLYDEYFEGTDKEMICLLLRYDGQYCARLKELISSYLDNCKKNIDYDFIKTIPVEILFAAKKNSTITCYIEMLSDLSKEDIIKIYQYLESTKDWLFCKT